MMFKIASIFKYLTIGLLGGLLFINAPALYQAATQTSDEEFAQHREFLAKIAPEAQKLHKEDGVLASISMAQAALESDWGRSGLSVKYNNYFGIKTTSDNPDDYALMPTKEFFDGKYVTIKQKFAKYQNFEESMKEHAELLKNGTGDNKERYKSVIEAKNYQEAATQLYKSGYATEPSYADLLVTVIEEWNLNLYDN